MSPEEQIKEAELKVQYARASVEAFEVLRRRGADKESSDRFRRNEEKARQELSRAVKKCAELKFRYSDE